MNKILSQLKFLARCEAKESQLQFSGESFDVFEAQNDRRMKSCTARTWTAWFLFGRRLLVRRDTSKLSSSLPRWTFSCFRKWVAWENADWHQVHLYGFSLKEIKRSQLVYQVEYSAEWRWWQQEPKMEPTRWSLQLCLTPTMPPSFHLDLETYPVWIRRWFQRVE